MALQVRCAWVLYPVTVLVLQLKRLLYIKEERLSTAGLFLFMRGFDQSYFLSIMSLTLP